MCSELLLTTFVETISFYDYIQCNGEQGAKAKGKMRLEGANYVCQPGDIFVFRFNKTSTKKH